MRNWSLGKQLAVCFGSLVALLFGLGFYAETTIGSLGASEDYAINGLTGKVLLAAAMDKAVEQMRSNVRGLTLAAFANNRRMAEEARTAFRKAVEEDRAALRSAQAMIDGAGERRINEGLGANLNASIPVFEEIDALCAKGEAAAAEKLIESRYAPLAEEADKLTDQLRDEQTSDLKNAGLVAAASVHRSRIATLTLLGISVVLAAVVFFVIRRINARLKELAGRLSVYSEQVSSAANQVSASSQSLAQGASQQAASLEETSSATQQVSSLARNNSGHSSAAADLVGQTNRNVSVANQSLDQMVTAMGEISASSGKISKIIKVIDEIAFQTNILALNAAVEAARAGEAGMGFAVVADEVRNLAQRSAQAAKETSTLIEESISRSSEGRSRVDQVTGAIASVTEDSARLKELIEELSSGSLNQTREVEQISKAVGQMEQVTQQSAANAEEGAAAGEQLSSQAQGMRSAAEELLQMVGGAK